MPALMTPLLRDPANKSDFSRDVEKEAWLADGLRELSEAGELSEVGELEEHFFAKVNSGESEWL